MKYVALICCLLSVFCMTSCHSGQEKKIYGLFTEWYGRKIEIPHDSVFTVLGVDMVSCIDRNSKFKIVSYVDSVGCISCRLRLPKWKLFITLLDSISDDKIPVCLFFSPENDIKEVAFMLKRENFHHPIWIDKENMLNKLNHFPADPTFQTFLLDKDNRVLAVGNPVHNPKVKELYLKIIRGENVSQEEETPRTQTTVEADRTEADMGRFDWREKQTAEFVLKNTGDSPLVIFDTHTSCGCTQAEYDGKPVLPGDSLVLRVTYKADNPGYFRKSVLVRSNAEQELLKLMVTGEAEERK